MSNTTVAVPVVAAIRHHIPTRTVAVAVFEVGEHARAIDRIVPYSVKSDAT